MQNQTEKNISTKTTQAGQTQSRTAQTSGTAQAADKDLINWIFRQLKAIFPAWASAVKDKENEAEMRRQWTLALREGGIRSSDQVAAAMARCRASESPFIPSIGQFVAWCKEAPLELAGFPKEVQAKVALRNELYRSYQIRDWSRHHPVIYWCYSQRSTFDWNQYTTKEFDLEWKEIWAEAMRMAINGFNFHAVLPKPDPKSDVKSESKTVSHEEAEKIINGLKGMFD